MSSSHVNTHMSWELSMTPGGGHSNVLKSWAQSESWSTIALEASCSSISRRSARRRRRADHPYQIVDEPAKKKVSERNKI